MRDKERKGQLWGEDWERNDERIDFFSLLAVLKKYPWKGISRTTLLQVDLGWLPDAHSTTLSCCLQSRTGGESRMKNLVGQENDREMSNQLLSLARQTELGET